MVGCGKMGTSHALAYAEMPEFEVAGVVSRTPASRKKLAGELGAVEDFASFEEALSECRPEAVCVSTYPDTHAEYVRKALEHGCHVFVEKPLATTVPAAEELVALARKHERALAVGYILRQHPAWIRFVEMARDLGKPLVMRMNLNQQSCGNQWNTHKNLMDSMSPIVDCGVHYVDVMCQMTRSRPVRVQAIGARLSEEISEEMYNYGQLQVVFEDGSVGWYEAGWGPMMSTEAFFVKDVIGPKGSLSIVAGQGKDDSSDIDSHTATRRLRLHPSALNEDGKFSGPDQIIDTSDEPDHQELCRLEQEFFLRGIRSPAMLSDHLADAVNSLRIVLAADESVRTGRTIELCQ